MSCPGSKESPILTPKSLVTITATTQETYKPSRFNARTIADDGALLLYNSYFGRYCAIPASRRANAEQYLAQAGYRGQLDKLGEYLLQRGYIVKSTTDESDNFDIQYGMQQYRQDALELMLLSSEDCNFRCIYCSQQFKRGSMLPHVRNGIKRLVESKIRRLGRFEISWFGGEPLMGYDAIEELAPFFQALSLKHEVAYTSGMTTNGYLLTPERSLALLRWSVTSYQITLDGTAEQHDAHRPLKEGGATFSTILANLKAMSSYDIPFEVALRINYDHTNAPTLKPFFELLAEHLGSDSRFKLRFRPVGRWGGPNDDQLDVCGMKEGRDTLIQISNQARSAGMPVEEIMMDLTPSPASVCYAARPYHFIVGADGKIMKCSVLLDTEESNIVGHLKEDGSLALNSSDLSRWIRPYYLHDSTCTKCFFLPVCQGASCPLPRFESQRPCPPVKIEIQQTLKDMYAEKQFLAAQRKGATSPSLVAEAQ